MLLANCWTAAGLSCSCSGWSARGRYAPRSIGKFIRNRAPETVPEEQLHSLVFWALSRAAVKGSSLAAQGSSLGEGRWQSASPLCERRLDRLRQRGVVRLRLGAKAPHRAIRRHQELLEVPFDITRLAGRVSDAGQL